MFQNIAFFIARDVKARKLFRSILIKYVRRYQVTLKSSELQKVNDIGVARQVLRERLKCYMTLFILYATSATARV